MSCLTMIRVDEQRKCVRSVILIDCGKSLKLEDKFFPSRGGIDEDEIQR